MRVGKVFKIRMSCWLDMISDVIIDIWSPHKLDSPMKLIISGIHSETPPNNVSHDG